MRARFLKVGVLAAAFGIWSAAAPVAPASATSAAVRELPAATHPAHSLRAVSCTSQKNCMAVGADTAADHGNGAALAETWNGTRWKVSTVKQPSGAVGSTLLGVSCASAKSCVAVGETFGTGNQSALAEIWSGAKWKSVKVPEPPNAVSNLSDVSCVSARSCVAVDAYNPKTPAQHWNGTSWKPEKIPVPASTGPSLIGVSCLMAKFCAATGTHYPNHAHLTAIVLFWNGSAWKNATVPSPGPGYAACLPTAWPADRPAYRAPTSRRRTQPSGMDGDGSSQSSHSRLSGRSKIMGHPDRI